jgi:hypothetical protein
MPATLQGQRCTWTVALLCHPKQLYITVMDNISQDMSGEQQFSSATASGMQQKQSAQQRALEKHVVDPKKRAILKHLVKKNTKCHHLQIYTQANVICRRISYSYEEGKISDKQAMNLMFEAHEEMSHKGLPKEVVAIEMHKRLDKLERNDKTSFAVIMANTNSSVHVREPSNRRTHPGDGDTNDEKSLDKYSEAYWAEII